MLYVILVNDTGSGGSAGVLFSSMKLFFVCRGY